MGNASLKRKLKRARTDAPFDHERRFLEDMLKANTVDGDLNKQELTEIQARVEERLWKACERLKSTELEVEDIVLCGSMAEGTRVWEYDHIVLRDAIKDMRLMLAMEFDFLAVLKTAVSKCEDQTCRTYRVVNGECKGHKVIMDNTDAIAKHLQPYKIRKDLRTEIVKFLNEDKTESRLVYHADEEDDLDDEPSINYTFLWNPCGLKQKPTTLPPSGLVRHDMCIVNVDLMPAFLYVKPYEEIPRYLVAKSKCHHETCFMKSYCMKEVRVLKEASQIHRDVYVLLKAFNIYTPYRAPSYYLKTAVLRHIEECDEPDLVVCHRQILQFLSTSYSDGKLVTFRGQINLLSGERVSPKLRCIPNTFLLFFNHVKGNVNEEYIFKVYTRFLEGYMVINKSPLDSM